MGRLKKEDIEFIKNNVGILTNKEMAKILNCHDSTITNWRNKLGLNFDKLHDFSKYNQYIIDNYYLKTSKKLAEEIGCSKSYVISIWNKYCNKDKITRRYYSNFSYFKSIDNPNKAYILGFLYSDGCVYKRKNHEGLWQITVHKKDIDILEKIKNEIESENPIHIKEKTATLSIVSDEMYEDLIKIGIIENKTYNSDLNIIFNNIPKNYWKDFIHGFFDGDGSITVRKKPSDSQVQFAIPERSKDSLIEKLQLMNIEAHWIKDNRHKYTIPFGSISILDSKNKYCLLKLFNLENTISLQRKTELSNLLCQQIQYNITNRAENKIAVIKWEEMLESLRR